MSHEEEEVMPMLYLNGDKHPNAELIRGVAERLQTTCPYCGHYVDSSAGGTHQYTKGWVKNRSGGGGHGVSLPERKNLWAHEHCINDEVRGFGQGRMLG